MELADFLHPDLVVPELAARTKSEVLAELVARIVALYPQLPPQEVLEVLLERERLGTTAIGDGVAIPHGKVAGLDRMLVAVGRSLAGVDFTSLDGKPVHIVTLVLAPAHGAGLHLKLLAALARLVRDAGFRQAFLDAPADRLLDLMTASSPPLAV